MSANKDVGGHLSHPGQGGNSLVFVHTGLIPGDTGIACKFGVQIPGNARLGLPTVQGLVTLLDPDTGVPLACLDGAAITTIRTAHGVVAAAELLARRDAKKVAIIGSGAQARELALCMPQIRQLSETALWSPTLENRERLGRELRQAGGSTVRVVDTARAAVEGADIIVTATLSQTPVVEGAWLAQGATVLTLGSYSSDRRELDLEATARADLVVVDQVAKATAQAGCVLEAFGAGVLEPAQLVPVGDILTGIHPGRTSPGQTIIFHSLGFGVQDAAAAWTAYRGAMANNFGTDVPF
ncbi:ornithine cyclodeaminase family protein [Arthrobacter humicola]|uniref:ornithine cyclodeaminase family protein n=1 Tax=Arthrobacter humicola TaxID=409291 RepID=UPI001FAD1889|nr:ornithine cyclodeaminase family protein [Arthrobacter humicola]